MQTFEVRRLICLSYRKMESRRRNPTRHKLREIGGASGGGGEQGDVHEIYAEHASVAPGRQKDCEGVV